MSDMYMKLAQNFTGVYFIHQLLVILMLFMMGFLLLNLLEGITDSRGGLVYKAVLSYPVGLCSFAIEAYFLLVTGIPYKTLTVCIAILIQCALSIFLIFKFKKERNVLPLEKEKTNSKEIIAILIVIAVLSVISCSGIIPISISNDSMYYFHEYPRDIVYFGHLRDQFDSFLTDTGLGAAAIETLPFLFGFNESFGIREMMHICFLVFTGIKVHEHSGSKVAGIVAFMIMAFSSPVYILGHWAMANMYFMELFFMSAVVMIDSDRKSVEDKASFDTIAAGIMCVACALLRMEGGIFILLLIACYTLLKIRNKELIFGIILPVLALLVVYEIRIYVFYKIDNPYTFLTPQKAILQAIAFLAVIAYICILRGWLNEKIGKILPYIFVVGLIGANGVLFVYNRELYMANLRAFYRNFLGQSGWGMLPQLSVGSVIILAVCQVILRLKNNKKLILESETAIGQELYFAVLTIGFALVTIAVSFMRGDALDVQVGDSGNRVMMQIAPLLIYTLILYFIRLNKQFKNE